MQLRPRTAFVTTVTIALISLIGAKAVPSAAQEQDRAKQELQRLQGIWTHLSREEGGKEVAGESKELKLVIKGDKWTFGRDGEGVQGGTLKIVDPAGSPKKLDLVITEGANKGKTVLAVYQVEGDVFKYCGSVDARPSSLQTKAGDGAYCSSFRKAKP